MPSETIFVTGASGYLGSHIVYQLLEKGYRVRATARGAKVDLVNKSFAAHSDNLEVIPVINIASEDLSQHMVGVNKVIHSAAPLYTVGDTNEILAGTIEGSLNIIRSAEKAGIKRIVYTSSIGAVINAAETPWTNDTWNPITKEQIDSPATAYFYGKTQAEKAVWEFADKHKHLDITVFCPTYIFGPLLVAPPTPDFATLSSANQIFQFLTPQGTFPFMSGYMDARDLAEIHIRALDSPPESAVGRKRMLLASPQDLDYKTAVDFVAEARPELKDRLVNANRAPKFPIDHLPTDLKRVAEVTGFKDDGYIPWRDTILNTVDSLVALEKDWISRGHSVVIPAYYEES